MIENFRHFEAGPDPFGVLWTVQFLWQQNGISIRHADTVDVKFLISAGPSCEEKVIALPQTALASASHATGHPVTDAWCMKIAGLHLQRMIETSEDIEKELVTLKAEEVRTFAESLKPALVADAH